MNGRHVLAPQGAGAIQNPAYRPAGNFLRDIEEKSLEISRLRFRARLLVQACSAIALEREASRLLVAGAIKSCHGPAAADNLSVLRRRATISNRASAIWSLVTTPPCTGSVTSRSKSSACCTAIATSKPMISARDRSDQPLILSSDASIAFQSSSTGSQPTERRTKPGGTASPRFVRRSAEV